MTLSKSAALGSLSDLVKHSRDSVEAHGNQLHYFHRFADMLIRLIRKQAPDLGPAIRYIIAPFTNAVNHEAVILQAEGREAEDLQDIAARYEVLSRQWSEYTDISKRLKDARDKLARLRRELEEEERRGGPKIQKLKFDIAEVLNTKKRYVEEGQAKLEQILAARQSYYAFTVRRLRHAYINHGKVLRDESRVIAAAFGELQKRVNEVRENIDSILDGTYTLPVLEGESEVPTGTAGVGGEEEEEEVRPKSPNGSQGLPVNVGAVPTPASQLGEGAQVEAEGQASFEARPTPYEPAQYQPPPYEPAPYQPTTYGQDGGDDDSPFPPE